MGGRRGWWCAPSIGKGAPPGRRPGLVAGRQRRRRPGSADGRRRAGLVPRRRLSGAATPLRVAEALKPAGVPVSAVGLWAPGEIVFSANSGDSASLWSLGVSDDGHGVSGPLRRLTAGTGLDRSPTIATDREGRHLFFASLDSRVNLYRLPVAANEGRATGDPKPLTDSAAHDFWPSVSVDGRTLVFASDRRAAVGGMDHEPRDPPRGPRGCDCVLGRGQPGRPADRLPDGGAWREAADRQARGWRHGPVFPARPDVALGLARSSAPDRRWRRARRLHAACLRPLNREAAAPAGRHQGRVLRPRPPVARRALDERHGVDECGPVPARRVRVPRDARAARGTRRRLGRRLRGRGERLVA